ncbi:MAG: DMT family transporter [Phycisphaeraceae bacterium]|nr:DMT family transporter [Phycisphaeraceae bacterium]
MSRDRAAVTATSPAPDGAGVPDAPDAPGAVLGATGAGATTVLATARTGSGAAATGTALGILTVFMTLAGWSSVPLFLRHFASSIDAWTSNGWRYGFSALLWAPLVVIAFSRRRLPPRIWGLALIPSLVNAAGQVCFTWAHYRIEPGLLTFGLRSQLVFVAIGAYLLFPVERRVIRHPGYLLGAALLLGGVLGTLAGDGTALEGAHLEGGLLAIGSGLLFACYGLSVRKYMAGVNPVVAFAVICQYTGLAMVILMLMLGDRAGLTAWALPWDQFGWLLISAVIGIALGHVFYYTAIARLGVAVSAGILQLQPFIVTACSSMIFGERLTMVQWVMGLIAITGALGMLLVQRRLARTDT